MKLFLISAFLLLSLTHGTIAENDGDGMAEYFENLKTQMNHDFHGIIENPELKQKAQSFIEDKQTEFEPLAAGIQIQLEELSSLSTKFEEQIKPWSEDVKEHVGPLMQKLREKIGGLLQTVVDHAKASHK